MPRTRDNHMLQPTLKTMLKFSFAVLTALLLLPSATSLAQFGGGGQGGGGLGGGNNTAGAQGASGVAIDADGVVRMKSVRDNTGRLMNKRANEAFALLDADVAKPSKLRKVSLTRLEKVLAKQLADGKRPDDTLLNLAGLTRIEYVFCYPETGDIVIAGPSEPWGADPVGRQRGLITGSPTIELADLVVALRCFSPNGQKTKLVRCSIDPTQDGLKRMQQFLNQIGGNIQRGDTRHIVKGLKKSLGDQIITINGISPKTHFAQVMVEADYRMKLIGIGLERPAVKIRSYVDGSRPSRNAMERWYFVPNYECIRESDDGMAMQLVGEGVKLVGESELVSAEGTRSANARMSRSSKLFVDSFTAKYPKLRKVTPVYAQLRNCVDMLVAAAFIQERDFYQEAKWDLGVLADESKFPVETKHAPEKVASAVNAIWKGSTLATPIGGGVEIRATKALDSANIMEDKKGEVDAAHKAVDLSKLPAGKWWWD